MLKLRMLVKVTGNEKLEISNLIAIPLIVSFPLSHHSDRDRKAFFLSFQTRQKSWTKQKSA